MGSVWELVLPMRISGGEGRWHSINRFHKWRTHGKKLVPSHENEAFYDKQLSCNK